MRHIPFEAGGIFVQKQGERAIDELYGTGLFESATLRAEPDTTGVNLVIRVIEKPYNYIRGGARFDLDYKSRAFIDFGAANVLGGGQEIFLSTTVGEKTRSMTLNIHNDRIFKTLFTSTLRVDYTELKRNYYIDHEYSGYFKQRSHGVELTPGRQIPQFGTVYIVGLARHVEWYEPGKPSRQEFDKLALGFRSVVDTRDAISFPENGKRHLFDLEFAGDIRDEKTAYTRFSTALEAFYPLTSRLNFHPRISVGISSAIMPYFDEFAFGGLNSFLGLYTDEFLGDKTLQGSIELRNKIGDRFYILGRYNVGNVWKGLESIKLAELRHGGGFGLGVKTPIGPIQTWFGRTDQGQDAFYLDIGYDW
jgi:outer membrane protein assembly factor BamA